eukprot:497153-Prorocentrum_minimum.AAC.4
MCWTALQEPPIGTRGVMMRVRAWGSLEWITTIASHTSAYRKRRNLFDVLNYHLPQSRSFTSECNRLARHQ